MAGLSEIRRVLGHRDFRFLWLAQSSSVIGDYLVMVALALFVIARTGSATDLGFVLAAKALPLIGFLLVGGVWADRLPRHRVMIATDLVRFALHGLLAVLIFAGTVPIWQLVAIEVGFGGAEAFFRPAADGLLPQTVPEEDIQQARALTAMSNNIAEFAGPALATALVLGAGAGWAFALDAVTFLLSAAFLTGVRPAGAARRNSRRGSSRRVEACGRRSARRSRGARADVGLGDALLLLRRPLLRARPMVRARPADRRRAVRARLGLRHPRGDDRGRNDHRRTRGNRLAPPLPDARRDAGNHSLAGGGRALRLRGDAVHRPPRDACGGDGHCRLRHPLDYRSGRADPTREPLTRRLVDWMVSGGLLPLGYALAGPLASSLGTVTVIVAGSCLALVALLAGIAPRETRMLERLEPGDTAAARAEELVPGLTRRH